MKTSVVTNKAHLQILFHDILRDLTAECRDLFFRDLTGKQMGKIVDEIALEKVKVYELIDELNIGKVNPAWV